MKSPLSEDEITNQWKLTIGTPMVSICCITYNHESYIEDTLIGFLTQKTYYSYEILIHDDASRDGTATIIRDYAEKYPSIIKPILQSENQLSKSIYQSINGIFNIPRAKGRYLMFCEGDDYWSSPDKLQSQVDVALSKNVDLVFHSVTEKNKDHDYIALPYGKKSRFVKFNQHFLNGPRYAPLSSILISRQALDQVQSILPDFIPKYLSHSFIQYIGFINGPAFYIAKSMSVYRVAVSGSWTERTRKNSILADEYQYKRIKSLLIYAKILREDTKLLFYLKAAELYMRQFFRKSLRVFKLPRS